MRAPVLRRLATAGGTLLLPVLVSGQAQALTWQQSPFQLKRFAPTGHTILISPLLHTPEATPPGFSLFDKGRASFEQAVAHMLRDNGINPLVEIRAQDTTDGLGLATGSSSHDFRFYVRGIPVCGFQVRAHELNDRSTLVLGRFPDIDPGEPAPAADWPAQSLALARAQQELLDEDGAEDFRAGTATKCFYVQDGRLLPVWSMTVYADGLPYQVVGDAYEVVSLEKKFFDVTGSGHAYEFNRITGAAKDWDLTDLKGGATLTSNYLRTVVPSGYTQAQEPSESFNYPETDKRFDEVQAYVHAQAHLAFFTKLGFQWYGPSPLEVRIHSAPSGHPNNALFMPGDDAQGTKPSITIDDGDGVDLQNLVTDGDVVSHEFGHHVIYKTLKTTQGESLVLHEGLADFFAFSRTGDPCLGESICPKGSGACIMEGQCLRTAANSLVYKDDLWNEWAGPGNRLGHLHGQLISGLLWDLRKDGDVPADDVTNLVFKTISYFSETSGFCDFVSSLLAADKELYSDKYDAKIRSVLDTRGLTPFLPETQPSCVELSAAQAQSGTGTEVDTSSHGSGKGNNPLACGVIKADGKSVDVTWAALLFALPLLLVAGPIPARARVLKKSRRRARS